MAPQHPLSVLSLAPATPPSVRPSQAFAVLSLWIASFYDVFPDLVQLSTQPWQCIKGASVRAALFGLQVSRGVQGPWAGMCKGWSVERCRGCGPLERRTIGCKASCVLHWRLDVRMRTATV